MTAIHDTPEYYLASENMKAWAFTHKGNYVSSEEAAKSEGVDNQRTVKVKSNTGEEVPVKAVLKWHVINPHSDYKQVRFSDGKVYRIAYMIKGLNPKGKTSIFFTDKDFSESEDAKNFKSDIDNAFRRYKEKHVEMLKTELLKSYSALAKKAIKELPEVAKDGGPALRKWFSSNGFEIPAIIKDESFDELAKLIMKNKRMVPGWDIDVKKDSNGHKSGISAVIDFDKKKMDIRGWSSD